MKLRLYDYQQEIYESIVKQLEGIAEYAEDDKKRKDMAAILMATGTGKSFITLKLLEDNPDKNILFVCPNNFIRTQMYGYILKYLVDENVLKEKVGHNDIQKMSANEIEKIANECYPGFKIRSYQIMNSINCKFGISSRLNNLFRKENNEEEEDINPDQDYIIFDELHRIGVKIGEKKCKNLWHIMQ